MKYVNGDVCVGEVQARLKAWEWHDDSARCGEKYVGAFADDVRHGEGKLTRADGAAMYEGDWWADQRGGHGAGARRRLRRVVGGGAGARRRAMACCGTRRVSGTRARRRRRRARARRCATRTATCTMGRGRTTAATAGRLRSADGSEYAGEWVRGKREGEVMRWPGGDS